MFKRLNYTSKKKKKNRNKNIYIAVMFPNMRWIGEARNRAKISINGIRESKQFAIGNKIEQRKVRTTVGRRSDGSPMRVLHLKKNIPTPKEMDRLSYLKKPSVSSDGIVIGIDDSFDSVSHRSKTMVVCAIRVPSDVVISNLRDSKVWAGQYSSQCVAELLSCPEVYAGIGVVNVRSEGISYERISARSVALTRAISALVHRISVDGNIVCEDFNSLLLYFIFQSTQSIT